MGPPLCQGAAAAANQAQPVQQRSCSALCDYSCPDVCSPPSHHWVSQKQMGNKPRGRGPEKESGKKQEKNKTEGKNCQAQTKPKRSRSPLDKQNKNNVPLKIILLGFVYSLWNSTERSGPGPRRNLATSKTFSSLGGHPAAAGSKEGSS